MHTYPGTLNCKLMQSSMHVLVNFQYSITAALKDCNIHKNQENNSTKIPVQFSLLFNNANKSCDNGPFELLSFIGRFEGNRSVDSD